MGGNISIELDQRKVALKKWGCISREATVDGHVSCLTPKADLRRSRIQQGSEPELSFHSTDCWMGIFMMGDDNFQCTVIGWYKCIKPEKTSTGVLNIQFAIALKRPVWTEKVVFSRKKSKTSSPKKQPHRTNREESAEKQETIKYQNTNNNWVVPKCYFFWCGFVVFFLVFIVFGCLVCFFLFASALFFRLKLCTKHLKTSHSLLLLDSRYHRGVALKVEIDLALQPLAWNCLERPLAATCSHSLGIG